MHTQNHNEHMHMNAPTDLQWIAAQFLQALKHWTYTERQGRSGTAWWLIFPLYHHFSSQMKPYQLFRLVNWDDIPTYHHSIPCVSTIWACFGMMIHIDLAIFGTPACRYILAGLKGRLRRRPGQCETGHCQGEFPSWFQPHFIASRCGPNHWIICWGKIEWEIGKPHGCFIFFLFKHVRTLHIFPSKPIDI